MAIDLISTIGGEESNSYVDVAYADDYFDVAFNALKKQKWQALDDDQKANALIQACSIIDQYAFTVNVDGPPHIADLQFDTRQGRFTAYVTPTDEAVKYNYYQALQFPRNLDVATDGTVFIPLNVCRAQCEQAVYLLDFDETPLANRMVGITLDRVNIGGQIEATQEYTLAGSPLAPMAYNLLRSFLITRKRLKRS